MKQITFILFLFITINSCEDSQENIDIKGKWYCFSNENGYEEFNFKASEFSICSSSKGNSLSISYKVENNTFNNKAKIVKISDSSICFFFKTRIDTLYKMSDSVYVYDEINWGNYHIWENNPIQDNFLKTFNQRKFSAWLKHGYITKEEYQKQFLDTAEITEETIPTKR